MGNGVLPGLRNQAMKFNAFSRHTLAFGIFTLGIVSLPMACDSVVGVSSNLYRPAGAACAYGWQCAEQACSAESAEGGLCGVCLDIRRLGEACGDGLAACSWTAECIDGICQSTKNTAGEPCENQAKGGSDDCDADLYCAGKLGGMGVCTALPTFGEPCGPGIQKCAGFGHCERGTCVAPREGALGDSCDDRPCMVNLKCHSFPEGHTCEEPNVVPLNGNCTSSIPNLDCAKGTSCSLTGGPMLPTGRYPVACLANKLEGEECASSRCADGLVCQRLDGETIYSCHPLRVEGENCQSADACSSGLECRNGTCVVECN